MGRTDPFSFGDEASGSNQLDPMSTTRLFALRCALVAIGTVCVLLGPLMFVWPSGWRWVPHHSYYEQMMVGIYFTLGLFLFRAVRNPQDHLSLIWFTACSSIVHGGIMTAQALSDIQYRPHLVADVPALVLAAALLGFLAPRRAKSSGPDAPVQRGSWQVAG